MKAGIMNERSKHMKQIIDIILDVIQIILSLEIIGILVSDKDEK